LPSAIAPASASAAGAGADWKFESGTLAASALGPPLSIGISNAGVELARIYKDWNPGNFIDRFTGEYICACAKRCLTKEAFENHVLAESQRARRMQYVPTCLYDTIPLLTSRDRCPICLKIFKSTAAIIAHWESPSLKCDLSEDNTYAQIVEEVSGGMIQIGGYNGDGTIRYEASGLGLHKTTGVDLDEIDW
jgi:hypothetical protein